MKGLCRTLTVLLMLCLLCGLLCACGTQPVPVPSAPERTGAPTAAPASETENAAPESSESGELRGETVEYGGYRVFVPEGFQLKEPGEFSFYDFSVQESELRYIAFITDADNDTMMQRYEYNKKTYTNEQEDVEGVYGDNAWTGFQYSDGWGGYGFEAYATLGEKIVRVSSAGYRFDSEVAALVLGSFAPQ